MEEPKIRISRGYCKELLLWAWRLIQMPHRVTKTLQYAHQIDQSLREIRAEFDGANHIAPANPALQVYSGYTESDLEIFERFSVKGGLAGTPGVITDFLGVRTPVRFVRGAERFDGAVLGIPVPDDGWHAEAIEYIGMLKSVSSAKGRFTAMELGAGWGPWSVAAAAAARLIGINETHLCAVEADPGHFQFIIEHFRENGLDPDAHTLINAAVGPAAGRTHFPKLPDPASDFGSRPQRPGETSQADHIGRHFSEWIEVDVVCLSDLLSSQPDWNLVHIDVQGWEADLCAAAAALLDQRVHWLIIGTHDGKLHGDLMSSLFQHGWILENEKPPRFVWNSKAPTLLAMTTQDGIQVWRNPKFAS